MDPAWILLKAEGFYNLPVEIIKYIIRQFIVIPRLTWTRRLKGRATVIPHYYSMFKTVYSGDPDYPYGPFYAPGMAVNYYVGNPLYTFV